MGQHRCFSDNTSEKWVKPSLYMSDDNEEKYEGVDDLFNTQRDEEANPPRYAPRLEISKVGRVSVF